MVFGEIVEPTTRALWENDYEEYPEATKPEFVWKGTNTLPNEIDKLIIGDTNLVIKILKMCVIKSDVLCKIENKNVEIYKIHKNNYVIICDKTQQCFGQIIEEISQWINKSKNVYVLTSAPMALFQGRPDSDNNIFVLTNQTNSEVPYQKLKAPNLVTGFGAAAFSYCIHNKIKCDLFIGYMDYVPIDSLTATPFINLLHFLQIGNVSPFVAKSSIPSHNLYI